MGPHLTESRSPWLRPISIPSVILMHPTVGCNRNGPKIVEGAPTPFGTGELDPHLTQSP